MKQGMLMTSKGRLITKEVIKRIEKALRPFKNVLSYKMNVNALGNSVYCYVEYNANLYKIRVSNHFKGDFDGLDIFVINNNSGIVKKIRNYINMLISNPESVEGFRPRINLDKLNREELEALKKRIEDKLST